MDEDDIDVSEIDNSAVHMIEIEDVHKRPKLSRKELCEYMPFKLAISLSILSYFAIEYSEWLIILYILATYGYELVEFGSLLAGSACLGLSISYMLLPACLRRMRVSICAQGNMGLLSITIFFLGVVFDVPIPSEYLLLIFLAALTIIKA